MDDHARHCIDVHSVEVKAGSGGLSGDTPCGGASSLRFCSPLPRSGQLDRARFANRAELIRAAAQSRLPTIYEVRSFAAAGGLISYGPDFVQLARDSASYVNEILRGTAPGDLPVQQPTKFELVVNLKTAKALGLTVPESFLLRADQVID